MADREEALYTLTEEVEREWQMSGLSGDREGTNLYADFAVEVARRALRSTEAQEPVAYYEVTWPNGGRTILPDGPRVRGLMENATVGIRPLGYLDGKGEG